MSYRSIKRLLGETSLERKCRIWFGIWLFVLFGIAFITADRVAENLIIENTRSKAHQTLATGMVRYHFEKIVAADIAADDFSNTADDISSHLGVLPQLIETFPLNDPSERMLLTYKWPSDMVEGRRIADDARASDFDEEMLAILKRKLADYLETTKDRRQQKEEAIADEVDAAQARLLSGEESRAKELEHANLFPIQGSDDKSPQLTPIYVDYRTRNSGEYYYYEVYQLNEGCAECHREVVDSTSALASDSDQLSTSSFVAVKTVLADKQTQAAINWIRAILIALAIVTVFLAMVATYVIVRYVIVKPLKHLTEISDDISRGNTELRADLQTGDEFERLAASFNRMLRHLIDTQKELRQVNQDLDRNVDELAQLNMRLYEVNQLKGEFLANMSHELRTPLNSIIGFSEVLQGVDSLSEKQKRYASNIRKSGRLLLDMINDILDLAKVDAGRMEVKPTQFRIGPVIEELVDMVRSLAAEKNIDLQVVTEADAPPLYQDQVKIQQILTNLLSNAIKFTPEGGRITITATRLDSQLLELSVRDTGVGIAQEDLAIIFEKFRQGSAVLGRDSLTREYSGTGLGLSIVKELCRLLGGEIKVDSEVGKGSVFTATLPWECSDEPPRSSALSTRLDELTRSRRSEVERPAWLNGGENQWVGSPSNTASPN